MSVEDTVKADFARRGVIPRRGELWQAICQALCPSNANRRKDKGKDKDKRKSYDRD